MGFKFDETYHKDINNVELWAEVIDDFVFHYAEGMVLYLEKFSLG